MSAQSPSRPARHLAGLPVPAFFHAHIPADPQERIITPAIALKVEGYRVRYNEMAFNKGRGARL
jgi:hypothetical protein